MLFYLKTKNDHTVDEVASALQKSIRRGKEQDAFYWAQELCPKYEDYLWKRISTIAYEDIGALVPGNIPSAISRMRDDYFYFRKKGDIGAVLVLSNAILLLSRSEKSRIADNFLITMGDELDGGRNEEIPDYALDKHTRRGRQFRRKGEHFVEEGTKLFPESCEIDDPYKEKFQKIIMSDSLKLNCFRWAREKKRNGNRKKNADEAP